MYCHLDYSFLGRYERFAEDSAFVLSQAKGPVTTIEHMNKSFNDRSKTLELFSQLTPDLVQRLYDMYRLDFEAFGYDTDGFL